MAQENATIKAVTADYDFVVAQMSALRSEMVRLAHSVEAAASARGDVLSKDVSDSMAMANSYLSRKSHDADARVEAAVSANPYIALGLAAGMGILLGALTRR